MKHLLKIIGALAIIIILYIILQKNKIIEGHGVGGRGGFGHGLGRGFGHGGGGRGRGGFGHGLGRGFGWGSLIGYGSRGYNDYDSLYYQQVENLCYDSLGNITPCIVRPYFFY